MAKNIVICSDGTGNSAIKGRGTNVFKLFEAVDLTGHRTDTNITPQVAFYDDGVGTQRLRPIRALAGIVGYGLSRNVKQLYKEIVRVYDDGDQIFLFGFSRGAFTVRTLAGFIWRCGLVNREKVKSNRELDTVIKKAYSHYRDYYRTPLIKLFLGKPNPDAIAEFKNDSCIKSVVPIRFIGVWDTVDAVGMPFHLSDLWNLFVYRFKFPDHQLNPSVGRACHALSLDDERHSFKPVFWQENGDKRIEQVWFAGAHSNVGGGYPKQGMSLVALDWMMAAAEESGLRFHHSDRCQYSEHMNVDDNLYDPRSGLGVFYRWKIRNVDKICRKQSAVPRLHVSVLERAAHGTQDYAPGNLPAKATVVITQPYYQEPGLLELRAQHAMTVLQSQQQASPIRPMPVAKAIGLLSYYMYLLTGVAMVVVAAREVGITALLSPSALLENVKALALQHPRLMLGLLGSFLLAIAINMLAESRMKAAFSQFWYKAQPELRKALKKAREVAQTATANRMPPAADSYSSDKKGTAVGKS